MNRFKFKTFKKLPIILEESIEYLKLMKTNPKMSPQSGEFYTKIGRFPIFNKNIRIFIFLIGSYLNPIFFLGQNPIFKFPFGNFPTFWILFRYVSEDLYCMSDLIL